MALKVAILGASGYSGAELVRLLSGHPKVKVTALGAHHAAGKKLEELYPWARAAATGGLALESLDPAKVAQKAQFVFLALPPAESMKLAPALLEAGLKVVDLSGAFRLKDPILYEKWYKAAHTAPKLMDEAVYGLPELYRKEISAARFVSNPGCYATSILLALLPAVAEGAVDLGSLIVDCKSGTSGAGRDRVEPHYLFSEASENFSVYSLGNHRHVPEVERILSDQAGKEVLISMTPQLLPVVRGILTTAYADLAEAGMSARKLQALYQKHYQSEPFVRVYNGDGLPDLRSVRGNNYCDLGIRVDERTQRMVVISCLDNLVKGAAGQAVQNMNLMCGFPEQAGLESPGSGL
jgi:N-acetyl-gamma-glutamyl-phosphate reductase